ncbi:spermatogenesis-associated protein 17 isoform X1 [Hippocampus comes]|uniref:spermatogenesis-associated protein 17 isoform X1 n=1 Tax=Hippocampus comes TaxID=109280 RepID=UPI00094E10D4|nr:PREDICTED: spermatogenesis-associated protein 17 isoform X1 [Hippocampus comes]
MAELLQIQCVLEEFRKLQFYKSRLEEATRQQEYRAALRIQSWFRGYRVRFYIRHLHEKAVIIQKIWRGFRARARCRQMVMEAYFVMKMNFYNEMAIRIQRRWRGFYVRKYIHSFYSRKSYLERISRTNELVRGEMDQLEELQKKERVCLKKVKEQKAKLYQAYRWHHLLSTKRCPGVFNSPFRLAPHEMELLLRQVKYQAPTKLVPRDCTPLTPAAPTLPSFHETVESPRSKTRAGCSPRPIPSRTPSTKQQVRIRDPGEMWEPSVHFPELFAGLHSSCAHLDEAQNDLRAYSGTSEPESMHHHLDHNSIGILHPSNVQTFA